MGNFLANKFLALVVTILTAFTFTITEAHAAKRLGGGGSSGMQRQAAPPPHKNPQSTPAQQQQAAPAQQPGPAAAASPAKRSWMGPIAGLAAGLGLAALASHLGLGEELASFMLMALLAVVVVAVIGFFLRKKASQSAPQGLQYANAGAGFDAAPAPEPQPTATSRTSAPLIGGGLASPAATAAPGIGTGIGTGSPALPAGFDAQGFIRTAKVNFIRLQAANDAGNLDDIREFTTLEMFAEIKLAIDERKGARQVTQVTELEAQVIEVVEHGNRPLVSVQFSGYISEDGGPAEPFAEIWHLLKPIESQRNWLIAGIQQVA